MNARGRSQVITVAVVGLIAIAAGCGRSQPASSNASRPGVTGTSYLVTVGRQPGGTVTSRDGQINCGTDPSANRCGPATYAWNAQAILVATPDAGQMFGTWAGDCVGRTMVGTEYVCVLDTTRTGADKYVVAVFGEAGLTQHTNFSSPTVHGPEAIRWFRDEPDTFNCRACHAANYGGVGIAPSCNECHARAGFPQASDCNTCHDSPPPPPHPGVPSGTAGCIDCHPTTADASGNIIAGGTHMNGRLDGGGHPDGFASPDVHGRQFFQSLTAAGSSCTACHGQNYEATIADGRSCNTCHASAGFASWLTNCTFCHGAPPPPGPAGVPVGSHPTVSSDLTTCSVCHATSIDPSGNSIAGGTHMNGAIEGGHTAGFVAPAVHGREFFEWISGSGGSACTTCHGASFEAAIADGRSCNTCHAGAGWTAWQTNCSFCHGVKNASTQAGYDVAANPTWSAPPDAISQRLGGGPALERTGAHAAHLTSTTDTVLCSACHDVPPDLTHISGREARAAVVLNAPVPAVPNQGYRSDGTCMTYCHDRAGANPSPAWTGTLECDGCHAVPPATTAHLGLSGAEASLGSECSGCHETIRIDGSIDPVWHINGSVESPTGHDAGFASRTVHGPQALDAFAGIGRACNSCHVGHSNCDSCHASATNPAPAIAWTPTSWDENCTFCHGTRTAGYTAANLALASPSDSINQRLTGSATSQARRIGKHREHLVFDGNEPLYPAFPCATCHTVPTSLSHISPSTPDRRASVSVDLQAAFPALTPTEIAALPNGASYDPVSGRCSVYCHGSTAWGAAAANPTSNPLWSTSGGVIGFASCNACHGSPPPTGTRVPPDDYCNPVFPATDCAIHEWHGNVLGALNLNGCDACHSTFVHLNGVPDIIFAPRLLNTGVAVSGSWNRTNGSCTVNCHTEVIDPGLTPPGNPQFWRQ